MRKGFIWQFFSLEVFSPKELLPSDLWLSGQNLNTCATTAAVRHCFNCIVHAFCQYASAAELLNTLTECVSSILLCPWVLPHGCCSSVDLLRFEPLCRTDVDHFPWTLCKPRAWTQLMSTEWWPFATAYIGPTLCSRGVPAEFHWHTSSPLKINGCPAYRKNSHQITCTHFIIFLPHLVLPLWFRNGQDW